jgi:putative resolvase
MHTGEWISEMGGGMNLRQKKFLAVMDTIERGEVGTVVITRKGWLARFGFDCLERVASRNSCPILVANQELLFAQEEVAEDLLAIVCTFSRCLDGLCRCERTLKDRLTGGGW